VNSNQVRTAYLNFFEGKGHLVIPSSPLIPHGDPTLLLTSAGMVQFKPYFLGEETPPSPRLTSCQKCFRTTDIESVGDSIHLTFFEMLGNFSIGDYFKEDAIRWAWEFVTHQLKLPEKNLWITIYLDDDEAYRYWRQAGVAKERILRYGEEHNFWGPAGDSGPCGPCSEIHYDFGEGVGCRRPSCSPGCDCGRFSEIWNLVFTQYNQDKEGKRVPLPKPNIDTGMGLERVAAVMQGKTSVYETDLFASLLEDVSRLTGKKYGTDDETDNAMRIVAEHGRGIAFLIADGVMPSNEGRGYVLRRLLRRAALFGRKLGIEKLFLDEIARIAIKRMSHIYPELEKRQDFVLKVIELEEARFEETLSTGLELLDNIMGKAAARDKSKISGKEAFGLYDTYGFPVELTTEIASGRGFSVDLTSFEREMEKQRERAKASQKFGESIGVDSDLLEKINTGQTNFVGYHNLRQTSLIVSILIENEATDAVSEGQEASLVLADTPFYGEMGGQVGDTGEIHSNKGRFSIIATVRIPSDIIVHKGRVTEGSLKVGDEVEAEVDKGNRLDITRNHTATHLLQAALRQVLGEHIQQRGSLVAPDRFTFDFSHLIAMTPEERQEVQRIVNNNVRLNLAVYDEELPYKKAVEAGAIALFDEKYGDVVRVLKIGRPPISTELCGGTHVAATGEIGSFYILSEHSIGSGLRRIEAVTGRSAEAYVEEILLERQKVARIVGAASDNVADMVASTAGALDIEQKRAQSLAGELAKSKAESLLEKAETINGVKVLVARAPSLPIETLREMSDLLREKLGSLVLVLGTVYQDRPIFLATVTPDLVAKGYNAGEIIRKVAAVTGGGGGGKPTLAQAGGKDKDKLDEALELVNTLI